MTGPASFALELSTETRSIDRLIPRSGNFARGAVGTRDPTSTEQLFNKSLQYSSFLYLFGFCLGYTIKGHLYRAPRFSADIHSILNSEDKRILKRQDLR